MLEAINDAIKISSFICIIMPFQLRIQACLLSETGTALGLCADGICKLGASGMDPAAYPSGVLSAGRCGHEYGGSAGGLVPLAAA